MTGHGEDPAVEDPETDSGPEPLGAVVIPPGDLSDEDREALARKLYERMIGNLPQR